MRPTPHDLVDQPTRHGSAARAENYLRTSGATLVAAGAVIGSPFIVFALVYKTYNLVRLGHWYTWGAPTPIGIFNRLM